MWFIPQIDIYYIDYEVLYYKLMMSVSNLFGRQKFNNNIEIIVLYRTHRNSHRNSHLIRLMV